MTLERIELKLGMQSTVELSTPFIDKVHASSTFTLRDGGLVLTVT